MPTAGRARGGIFNQRFQEMERAGNSLLFAEPFGHRASAAILFSAGRVDAAVRILEEHCGRPEGGADAAPWFMLFEIYCVRKDHDRFDALAQQFRGVFGKEWSPPWGPPPTIEVPGVFRIQGVLASMRDLDGLAIYAKARTSIAVDFGRVERITYDFAPALCALLRTFSLQSKRVILANVPYIHAELLHAFGLAADVSVLRRKFTGRSDDACRSPLTHAVTADAEPAIA